MAWLKWVATGIGLFLLLSEAFKDFVVTKLSPTIAFINDSTIKSIAIGLIILAVWKGGE